MNASNLVTVIIPAYNAGKTIDETLHSVRAQTYASLEVLAVDDGSTDETPALIERHAAQDRRVRLIRQSNGGVAAARNRAIAEAAGDFIAPIDSDDLWSAEKIEKQMLVMQNGGSRVGLVYTWQATIDESSRITGSDHRPIAEGHVLAEMFCGNLVGSGSGPLMRKEAIVSVGGYDASLRAREAQGCEDYKMYLQISARYDFAVIREFLTGYRLVRGTMSSDFFQMLRSYDFVAAEASVWHPQEARLIHKGQAYMRAYLWTRALQEREIKAAMALAKELIAFDPRLATMCFARGGLNLARAMRNRALDVIRARTASEIVEGAWFIPRSAAPEARP